MAESVDNLVLEHLKRFQATLDRVDRRLEVLTIRQTETHSAVLALHRDQRNDTEITVPMQTQMDRFRERLERIERRLDLSH